MKVERILLDVQTQDDFFAPGGSRCTPQSPAVARNIYRLFRWAMKERIPVVSTVLRVRPSDVSPLQTRPFCVEGGFGERKLLRTVLPRRVDLGLRNVTDLPRNIFARHQQVVFEMRQSDIFRHAPAERLFTELEGTMVVVFGADLAGPIAEATIGLRARGFAVVVASDAVLDLGDAVAQLACRRMEAKGAVFAPTAKIVVPLPQPKRTPRPASVLLAGNHPAVMQ